MYLGLSHWDDQVKVALFIITTLVPILITLVFLILWFIFKTLNNVFKSYHEGQIKKLEQEEMILTNKINGMCKN